LNLKREERYLKQIERMFRDGKEVIEVFQKKNQVLGDWLMEIIGNDFL